MYQVRVQAERQGPGDGLLNEEASRLAREMLGPQAEAAAEARQDGAAAEVEFTSGNPRVEHVVGVVHLYRRVPTREEAEEAPQPPLLPEGRSELLALLAVPADVAVAELYAFFGAYLPRLRAVKFVRRARRRTAYLALLRFDSQAAADAFYGDLNDRPEVHIALRGPAPAQFSALEPEVLCRLVFVREVEVTGGAPGPAAGAGAEGPLQGPALVGVPKGQTELPSCPVCLERLDQHISGVTTTVCHHRFHNECLQRWGDTRCPVCRYCAAGAPASSSRCTVCNTHEDLWICLICGHVGCGRYRAGHAADHWRAHQHAYALELATQRVWDYPSDAYVHRLVQSKADGKLVALPSPPPRASSREAPASSLPGHDREEEAGGRADPALEEALVSSKLHHIQADYDHLIVTQLERQREYFEGLLGRAAAEHGAAAAELRAQARALHALQVSCAEAAAASATEEAETAKRTCHALESRLADRAARLGACQREQDELRALNEALLGNQAGWQRQVQQSAALAEERGRAVAELQEQVRDLMFALEAGQAIAQQGGEAAGGSVLPVPAPPKRRGGRKKG